MSSTKASEISAESGLENLASQMIEGVSDYAIILLNAEGIICSWNLGAGQIIGYEKEEIVGQHFSRLYTEDAKRRGLPKMLLGMAARDGRTEDEGWRVRKDGGYYWASVVITSIKDGEGRLVGFTKITRDLSERRRAEEHLQASLMEVRQLKIALDQHAMVSMANIQGDITYANEKFCEISQYSMRELIGSNHRLLSSGHHPTNFWRQMWTTVASGATWHGEICNQAKDGSLYWVDTTIVPLQDDLGKVIQYISILTEVTQRKRSEEEAQLARNQLQGVLNSSTEVALIATDSHGIITLFNVGAEKMLGYAAIDMEYRQTPAVYHLGSEIIQRGRELTEEFGEPTHGFSVFVEYARRGRIDSREWTYVRKDGSCLIVNLVVTAIRNRDYDIIGYLGASVDVTQRIQMEQALRKSQELFRSTMEHAPIGMAIVSPEGRWLQVNPALCRLVGYEESEMLAIDFQTITHPDDLESDLEHVRSLLRRGSKTYEMEKRYFHKNGQIIWVQLCVSLVLNPDGTPRFFVSQIQDITGRKKTEHELQQISERYRLATNGARVGVWDFDVVNNKLWWDEPMYDLYGVPHGRVDLAYDAWSNCLHPADRERAELELRESLRQGPEFNAEFRIIFPNNEARYIKAYAQIQRNAAGDPLRMVGVNWDITLQKKGEELILAAKEAAESANMAKSEFLALMSHEIRTPLNGVLGFAQVLAISPMSDQQKEYVQTILLSGKQLLNVINDILDYSKIEAGKFSLEAIAYDLQQVVRETARTLSAKAADKRLSLNVEYPADLPSTLMGDPYRVQQILTNLVGNAIKFTSRGEVRIQVALDGPAHHPEAVRISVTDTGIGIPEEKLGLLFRKFTQIDTSNTRRFGGTGLGLAISKSLTDLMDGKIGVNSVFGQGSTFWFTLPLSNRAVVKLTGTQDPVPPIVTEKPTTAPVVLLAEDLADNQRLVLAFLDHLGCQTELAANGHEAVSMAREKHYDLILLDCHMPEMNGFDACLAIRRHQRGRRTPIVALTASVLEEDRERCRQADMDAFLAKPLHFDELKEVLRRWSLLE